MTGGISTKISRRYVTVREKLVYPTRLSKHHGNIAPRGSRGEGMGLNFAPKFFFALFFFSAEKREPLGRPTINIPVGTQENFHSKTIRVLNLPL